MRQEQPSPATIDFLKRVPLLRHARGADLQNIVDVTELRSYDTQEVIFWQGSEGRELFIVESGEVTVTHNLSGRVDSVIARFGPRQFFGEMRVILGGPRSATAQATLPTRLIVVPGRAIMDLIEHRPETGSRLLLALVEELADRLSETNARLRDAIMWGLDATGFMEEYAKHDAPGALEDD